MINQISDLKIAVIGLGYVGLPLVLEFSKKTHVVGFDTNKRRIRELKFGKDKNLEFGKEDLKKDTKLQLTHNVNDLKLVN